MLELGDLVVPLINDDISNEIDFSFFPGHNSEPLMCEIWSPLLNRHTFTSYDLFYLITHPINKT